MEIISTNTLGSDIIVYDTIHSADNLMTQDVFGATIPFFLRIPVSSIIGFPIGVVKGVLNPSLPFFNLVYRS